MRFGVCVLSRIDDAGYAARVEDLGYDTAWYADNQMIWSDPFACMALAAQATRRLRIGTGVCVAGLRLAPTTAAAIASINRIAPGRTFLTLGRGFSAYRMMGQKGMPMREFEEYVRVVRAMLAGEEVDYELRGQRKTIQFGLMGHGWIDVEPRIPVLIDVAGNASAGVAGRHADGMVGLYANEEQFRGVTERVYKAGEKVGRSLAPESFSTTTIAVQPIVLDPGEDLTSPRVVDEAAIGVVQAYHVAYERMLDSGEEPPASLHPHWEEYRALVEQAPEHIRHARVHWGHCTVVHPDERKFVTTELVEQVCFYGTPDELAGRLEEMERAGVQEFLVLPDHEHRYSNIERFARLVMDRLR